MAHFCTTNNKTDVPMVYNWQKKMKKGIFFIAVILSSVNMFAQTSLLSLPNEDVFSLSEYSLEVNSYSKSNQTVSTKNYSSFTRGSGFVMRPELYRGLYATFGYQINPYVQTFLSVGYGDGFEGAMGVRAYTGDADWAAMFDLRFSLTEFVLPGASLVAGASYKDLDFGAGLKYYTDGYSYLIVPVISVGWNIRCYVHR